MIKSAAILVDGFMYVGKRHDTIINGNHFGIFKPITESNPIGYFVKPTQGFITHEYEFIDRKEAGLIAWKCHQIDRPTDCLFSEDLY